MHIPRVTLRQVDGEGSRHGDILYVASPVATSGQATVDGSAGSADGLILPVSSPSLTIGQVDGEGPSHGDSLHVASPVATSVPAPVF